MNVLPPLPELVAQFLQRFIHQPAGQDHLARYATDAAFLRTAFEDICRRADAGEDVTERVLMKLLPHRDTPYNRQRGAWTTLWAIINREIQPWFQSVGWVADAASWRDIATHLLRLLRALERGPQPAALEAFATSPLSRGFRAGFLSPALHALRPDLYLAVNARSRRTAHFCLALWGESREVSVGLEHYLEATATLRFVLERLKPLGIQDANHFDAFCHWMCDRKLGGFLARRRVEELEEAPGDEAGGEPDEEIGAWVVRNMLSKRNFRAEIRRGRRSTWTALQRGSREWLRDAEPGDLVFLYQASPVREVLGLGKLASEPASVGEETRFEVEFLTDVLAQPIPLSAIQAHSTLSGMMMASPRSGMVLPIRADELPPLARLIRDRNPEVHEVLAPYLPAGALLPEPSPPRAPRVLELAAWVDTWRRTAGHPDDTDGREAAQREAWARMLAPEALGTLTPEDFRPVYQLGVLGSAGPVALLNRFFLEAREEQLAHFRATLREVLHGEGRVELRLDRALDRDSPTAVKGLSEGVLMKCLAVVHPERFLGIHCHEGDTGKARMMEMLGLPPLPDSLPVGTRAVRSNDALREALAHHLPGTADRPATQAMRRFLYWLKARLDQQPPPKELDPAERFLHATSLRRERLEELCALLEHRRQLILYGPPGTGKTFIARELARYQAGAEARCERVQFHPAYSYEDFVEGLRPQVDAQAPGGLRYEYRPGILKSLAERAQAAPTERFVLLIDEINRGALPRVFGELLYLLEYREERVRLAGSGDFFELPTNLYLIGTMNSADRSIAQIDVALRRRFHFVRMDPDAEILRRNLLKWDVAPDVCDWAVQGLEAVNARIARSPGREFCIGHSFFMDKDLDPGRVERIWRHDIAPMLEDCFYDSPQVVPELRALFDAARPGPVDMSE
ncbi:AAA family ATPase [Stigmatella sp. ncwal1]|uniref:AAA family ATPase n=1 Tax=Stigmatella ashevillensis TaxID=2995309 RepID=A0ABT5DFK1_9BACT|nr:AAA family ATPase [Stigmatella ashevillena]MDC0712339.1 AAA family ATPase [Stigmatella ashevillena]